MQARQDNRGRSGNVAIEYVCILSVITIAMGFGLARLSSSVTKNLDKIPDANTSTQAASVVSANVRQQHHQQESVPTSNGYSVVFLVIALVVAVGGTSFAMRKHRVADEEVAPGDAALTRSVARVSRGLFSKRQQILTSLSTHWHSEISSELVVAELMTTGPKSVARDCTREELSRIMDEMNLHHTLVVENNQLLGIISDRDLKNRQGETAGDLMTAAPRTVSPTTRVSEAIEIILRQRFSCLPVMRDSEVCGILTTSDLAMGFQCTLRVLDQIGKALSGDSREEGPSPAVQEKLMAHLKA